MRVLFLMVLLSAGTSRAFANCYVLQNNTDSVQTWHFQYAKPLPGAKTDLKLAPPARFPANRDWCWSTPSDYYVTARVDPGAYTPSWQGTLIFGNSSNASPSGTYSLEPIRRSSAAPSMFYSAWVRIRLLPLSPFSTTHLRLG
jgi:hypothetical protein